MKRLGAQAYMRREAQSCWGLEYVQMCDYLDEIDEGNLAHLDDLIQLCEEHTKTDGWCSFDDRLREFTIPSQQYQYDSEGLNYETRSDVELKVKKLLAKLDRIKNNASKSEFLENKNGGDL